ncbi:bleomycin resistance protein [Roseobacter cerasinus]|uniref:Bleomycin resistance protein n=1 Tax=Roseobacter cerasinus TaxID=2602289 RepID=A0A640VML1_9RHOB|nr:VOC family protein [Roseobacter cerasinus]GFE49279.1 bleomycin resistance protein [Roseobacter cerasinus]
MLEQICPILPSSDFARTEGFYTSIGFKTQYKQPDQYMLMNRDQVEIHFFYCPGQRPEHSDHGAYLRPVHVDVFSAEVASLNLPDKGGFPRFWPAEDKPWGMREAVIWDPDGNILRIGQDI